jgi:AcrR family transcriptional regulator
MQEPARVEGIVDLLSLPNHFTFFLTTFSVCLYLPVGMKKAALYLRHGVSAKEAIRTAAAELFAERGYTATSTREICQRAGITKPVLYYHFGNKAQLYEELVLDAYREYQREVRRASQRGRSTRERLIETLHGILAFARRKDNEYRLAVRMTVAPEKETPAIDFMEMGRADERLLTAILREGVRKGEVKGRPQQIAGAMCGIAFACIMSYLLSGHPTLDRKLARDTIHLLMDGCGNKSTDR